MRILRPEGWKGESALGVASPGDFVDVEAVRSVASSDECDDIEEKDTDAGSKISSSSIASVPSGNMKSSLERFEGLMDVEKDVRIGIFEICIVLSRMEFWA